jgi:peptide-methionine (S)-S-oxide reductase
MATELIYFGGGCFWCVEAVFKKISGVLQVQSGYMGGHIKNPSYREVCNGTTGHAEVVAVTFDNEKISLEQLLEVFWNAHDPTTLNRQGADKGTQYRSAIFCITETQLNAAEKSAATIAAVLWEDPVVTEIKMSSDFYPAEDYHNNYFELHPEQAYCSIVIAPKVNKVKKQFSEIIKE